MNLQSEFWDVLRIICFVMLFASFMILTYKGAFSLALDKDSFDWARFLNLSWILVTCYGIGELLFLDAPGGARLVALIVVAALNLYVALFKFSIKEVKDKQE